MAPYITMNTLEICRLCCENNATSNIFQSNAQIYKKILYCCVNIKIKESDGLPTCICLSCEQELDNCYRFVLKCEESDKNLRAEIYSAANQIPDFKPKFEVKDEFDQADDSYHHEEISSNNPVEKPEKNIKAKRKREIKNKNTTCFVCGKTCSTPSFLAAHMRSHSNEKPFQCTSCSKRYKDKGALKRHIGKCHVQIVRDTKFICETCGKAFSSKYAIKIHLRIHTGETPHSCSSCGKRFSQISSLKRHKLRHIGERPHKCAMCSKGFYTTDELKTHTAVHTSDKNYSCPYCEVTFKYATNVKKHINVKHNVLKPLVCSHCGRTFSTKGILKSHISTHHSEKSGYCSICNKDVSNLEVHMRKHTGERPLKCEHCSSGFSDLRALSHHINFKHKLTDRYKCTVDGCSMSFPSKPMLDFHTAKVHDNEKPFPCDKCSRRFYRKSDLARHKIGTHKERLQ